MGHTELAKRIRLEVPKLQNDSNLPSSLRFVNWFFFDMLYRVAFGTVCRGISYRTCSLIVRGIPRICSRNIFRSAKSLGVFADGKRFLGSFFRNLMSDPWFGIKSFLTF